LNQAGQTLHSLRLNASESGLKDDDGLKDRVSPLRSGEGQGEGVHPKIIAS